MRRRCLTELLGTFVLVFAGTGAIVINEASGGAITHVGIAITFGLVVLSLIYTIGEISGAHINPAVTIGLAVSKRFPKREVAPYIVAQLIGAILASALLAWMFPENDNLGGTIPKGSIWRSFGLEIILTAFLMFAVLSTALGTKEKQALAGVSIGSIIALEALFAGPICGASMNPARSFAPALISGKLDTIWIYLTAPILGALIAIPIYKGVEPPVSPNA